MNKIEQFNTIVSIVKEDYAGYQDKMHLDKATDYLKRLNEEMNEEAFIDVVNEYLMEFKDHHLKLLVKNGYSIGFKVRRYQDLLYVTEVSQETELQVGDMITHLDGMGINEIAKQFPLWLGSEIYERQDWIQVIKKHQTFHVRQGGVERVIEKKMYEPLETNPEYSFSIKNSIPILKFTDFDDSTQIHQLIDNHKDTIMNTRHLVIDVRTNNGGSDLSYFPLLDFIFIEKTSLKQIYNEDTMSILYSKRNCDLRINMFESYLEEDLPDDVRQYLTSSIERFKINYGKGFITESDDSSNDYWFQGNKMPENIYILTDCYCGSSGDSFVLTSKKSPKVTVVGRNTKGVIDYSNVAFYPLAEYQLMYPTSRMNWVDAGRGIDNKGVDVDIYIPFTPEHIQKDCDLKWVMDDIYRKENTTDKIKK